jgi:hypothetical protein
MSIELKSINENFLTVFIIDVIFESKYKSNLSQVLNRMKS